jgi:uncharacterized protein DUF1566
MAMKHGGLVVTGIVLLAVMVFAPPVLAGDLDPPGPPGPTMKTLDEIPGSWHRILPASERFVVVMNNQAVLDKETGLVWQKSPSTFTAVWGDAVRHCIQIGWGGRVGWRLPTIEELGSLVDVAESNPALPVGHPFTDIQSSSTYWSVTTNAVNSSEAWGRFLSSGVAYTYPKTNAYLRWCVRGGSGLDGQ